MVNMKKNDTDLEVEITNDESSESFETELIEDEVSAEAKAKKLREKLAICEEEKKKYLDDLQLAKADFLNARKRLDEERTRDRIRYKISHVEELLPLCDSFEMAMNDKEAWSKADPSWRTGVEGIYSQLNRLLASYGVTSVSPVGEHFDPYKHEAVGTEEVEDKKLEDVVISVVQLGYEIKSEGKTEMIRPARVTTGKLISE